MNSDTVWQLVRYVLLAAGGYLVNKGYTDQATLTGTISAIVVVATFAWGVFVKWQTRAVPQSAINASVVATPAAHPVTGIVATAPRT